MAYTEENERKVLPIFPKIDRITTFIDKQPHAPALAPIIEPTNPGLSFLEPDRRIFTRNIPIGIVNAVKAEIVTSNKKLNVSTYETEKIQNGSKKIYPEKIESKINIPIKIPIENMRYFK